MSGGVYGGDEVGALVFDPGHGSFRAGYAGEDAPKADIPTVIGVWEDDSCVDPMYIYQMGNGQKKYNIGLPAIKVLKRGMELQSFLKDGMIDDWDLFEKMIDYVYNKSLRTESSLHPLLMSDAPWNTRLNREKLTEFMFEKYNVPAFYVARNAQLAAYCNGRPCGVVLDCGATHTTAIPIHDGHVLTQAVVKTILGGDFLSVQSRQYLEDKEIKLTPSYLVASKEVVKENEKAKWVRRGNLPELTASWCNYMVKDLLQDFHANVLQVSDSPYDEEVISALPMVHYEFPNGYHQDFGAERFRIPEILFDTSVLNNSNILSAPQIVTTSIGLVDIDVRPSLCSTIIVTGGNSLLQGFSDRLHKELAAKTPPSLRLKVISSNAPIERRYGAWIGGSILASLGSFQQEWMSRQEYDEFGKSLVERRCR